MAVGAKVKGITIEFNGDTTKLGKALKEIDTKSKGVDRALRQVNNALKFNPKNTELIAQKQTLLKQKVDQTRQRLEALRQTQARLDDDPAVDKTSQDYMELRREIITTESKLKHFQAEQKKLDRVKFTNLGNSFKNVGSKITSVGRTITTTMSVIGAAAIYAGKQMIAASQAQTQAEQKLAEIYKTRMGANKQAVKSTLELASAQQKVGVVGDEVALSFAQQMATYSSAPSTVNKLIPAFENLLVQQKGLNGTQEDAVGLANMFGKAMMGQAGALKRAGISFTDAQAEVLKYGTEEEKASMLAEVITQNVGHMNEEFAKTDAGKIQQAKNSIGDMAEEIGAILLPAVANLVSWLQEHVLPKVQQFINFMKEHPQLGNMALAITAIVTALGPLVMLIGTIVSGVGSLISFIPTLLGPIGLVIAAVAAAIAIGVLIVKNWQKIKAAAIKIWTAIKNFFVNIWKGIKAAVVGYLNFIKAYFTTIWTGIKLVATKIWAGIKTAVLTPIRAIKNFAVSAFSGLKSTISKIWNGIKTAITHPIQTAKAIIKKIIDKIKGFFSFDFELPHIKLPHFTITPKGWKFKDLLKGKIPKLGIDWYAKGGIFNNPSVIGVGEAGSEAVVPLDKFWKKLDAIAATNSPMVVNVYGSPHMSVDELATAVQQKIIQTQKRRAMAWQ